MISRFFITIWSPELKLKLSSLISLIAELWLKFYLSLNAGILISDKSDATDTISSLNSSLIWLSFHKTFAEKRQYGYYFLIKVLTRCSLLSIQRVDHFLWNDLRDSSVHPGINSSFSRFFQMSFDSPLVGWYISLHFSLPYQLQSITSKS